MKNIPHILTVLMILFYSGGGLADSEQTIKWKERNNRILHASVCFNHEYGSINYRGCMSNAKQHFKAKCSYYRNKVKKTKYPHSKEFIPDREKFCYSASQFNPL